MTNQGLLIVTFTDERVIEGLQFPLHRRRAGEGLPSSMWPIEFVIEKAGAAVVY
jgi:hypothetical protein